MNLKNILLAILLALALVVIVVPVSAHAKSSLPTPSFSISTDLTSIPVTTITGNGLGACNGVSFTRNLTIGSTGTDVKCLQQIVGNKITGTFGPKTLSNLKKFQKAHGITGSGNIGPKTKSALSNDVGSVATTIKSNIVQPVCGATFGWDKVLDPIVKGYKIHWGTAPGVYSHVIDAGDVNSLRVEKDLGGTYFINGVQYYTAITSYDAAKTESDLSSEVTWIGCSLTDTTTYLIDPILKVMNSPVAYDGQPKTAEVQAFIPGKFGDIPVLGSVTNIKYKDVQGNAIQGAPINAGIYSVTANFSPAFNNSMILKSVVDASAGPFVIQKVTPTLSVTNSPVVFDNKAHSANAKASDSGGNLIPGTVTNVLTGGAATQTAPGSYPVTAGFTPSDSSNYESLPAGTSAGYFVITDVGGTVPPVGGGASGPCPPGTEAVLQYSLDLVIWTDDPTGYPIPNGPLTGDDAIALAQDLGIFPTPIYIRTVCKASSQSSTAATSQVIPPFPANITQQIALNGSNPVNGTYVIVTQPAHGALSHNPAFPTSDTSKYIYTPANTTYTGPDSFIFDIDNGPAATVLLAIASGAAGKTPPTVVCSGVPSQALLNQQVVWMAAVAGNTDPYSFKWSGSVSGDKQSLIGHYTKTGIKTATVTVTDSVGNVVTSDPCKIDVETSFPKTVNIVSPNGGTFIGGSTISWTGGGLKNPTTDKVQIGLVDSRFATNHTVLGWITLNGSSDGTIKWDGLTVSDLSGAIHWSVKNLSQGPYKIIAVSSDAVGNYCTSNSNNSCNVATSDNFFTIAQPSTGGGGAPLTSATCVPSSATAKVNESTSFDVRTVGGHNLSYNWTGDEDITSSYISVSKRFQTSGTKTVHVTVTDPSGPSFTATCTIDIEEPTMDDLTKLQSSLSTFSSNATTYFATNPTKTGNDYTSSACSTFRNGITWNGDCFGDSNSKAWCAEVSGLPMGIGYTVYCADSTGFTGERGSGGCGNAGVYSCIAPIVSKTNSSALASISSALQRLMAQVQELLKNK